MAEIIIKNIYRTNLSQPGGLVRVLEVVQSDYNLDGKACYIEHVEPHPYGYPQGTKGWYEDRDLVTVCQDCGEDLPEGATCNNCTLQSVAADEVTAFDDWNDGGENLSPADLLVSWRSRLVITATGAVWDVTLRKYGDGRRECTRQPLVDTCENIEDFPF